MAVTLTSLARQIGVDPSLVSRVLRGDPRARVSDAKRAQILQAARTTGYRANRLGKSLRTQQTMVLGMLTPDITNPFHSWLFRAVEERANAAGYDVLLCNTDDDLERSKKVIQTLSEGHVDGLLVATAREKDPALDLLNEMRLPFVLMNRRRSSSKEPWYGPDAHESGRTGAEHLLALGHRRIAFLQGDLSVGQMADRLKGFRAALAAHKIRIDKDLVVTGLNSIAAGRAAVTKLMSLPKGKRPTALFVPNTVLTEGAVYGLFAGGWRVPEEISLLGYSAGLAPEVTSLCVPTEEIGRRATDHLIGFLAGGGSGPVPGGPQPVEVRLIDRGTTAPPPAP